MIQHIVLWKFKEDPSEFLSRLEALRDVIPCIRSMQVLRSAVKDAQYDAVLISTFDSLEDVETYKNDPRHVEVAELCKKIRISRSAIDVEI